MESVGDPGLHDVMGHHPVLENIFLHFGRPGDFDALDLGDASEMLSSCETAQGDGDPGWCKYLSRIVASRASGDGLKGKGIRW